MAPVGTSTEVGARNIVGTHVLHNVSRAVAATNGAITTGFYFLADDVAGPVLLTYDVPGDASCVDQATLSLSVRSAPAMTLSAYPVWPRYASLTPGEQIVGLTLIDNRPRADLTFDGTTGRADVTDAIRLFRSGGPFPSQHYGIAPGSPATLSIQPQGAERPETVELIADPAPTLTLVTHC